MKKKLKKILSIGTVLIILIGVGIVANSLVGNPISKLLAKNTAKEYLSVKYDETDYKLKNITFSFKDGNYYAHIISPSNIDGNFSLIIGMNGKLKFDNYDYFVEGKSNVANRLFMEYKSYVEAVFESPVFPYSIDIGFGDLEFEREINRVFSEEAINKNELVNNKIYDVKKLGKTNGRIVLYVNTDSITAEKAAEIMLVTKSLLCEANISFYSMCLCLRHPVSNEKTCERPEGSIYIKDFLSADIYEEGIVEKINESIKYKE